MLKQTHEPYSYITSFIQWLDAFWFMRFKMHYRAVYARTMHGRNGKLSASEKRTAAALFVGEAHEMTLNELAPTLFDKFVQFGYVHTRHPSEIRLFTSPGYTFTSKDAVIEQFNEEMKAKHSEAVAPTHADASRRQGRQASITSFFVQKDNN